VGKEPACHQAEDNGNDPFNEEYPSPRIVLVVIEVVDSQRTDNLPAGVILSVNLRKACCEKTSKCTAERSSAIEETDTVQKLVSAIEHAE